jgi:hypothetical protein
MVNVTNRANIHMRLGALEFTFCHLTFPKAARQEPDLDAGRLATTAGKHKGLLPVRSGLASSRTITGAIIAVRFVNRM